MITLQQLANAIRFLSMDAVQKANSGHPGMPMGMADVAAVLWKEFLSYNPANPRWINRDRFILSNGHGSMLQYALLHLTGYDLTIDDIKQFRQLYSKTPGHPEFGHTPGVEATTGPLGQGIGHAVGMAIAERTLASSFNRPDLPVIDHHTYVFLGDGCLMEGVSHEVCSLAGTLGLGKLIAFWDNNGISIDGPVSPWFTENMTQRFEAYHWHVISDVDGHNPEQIRAAIIEARKMQDKPTLIACKTTLAFGAPHLAGTAQAHGAPLGEKEIAETRKKLGWDYPAFVIPDEIYRAWDMREQGAQLEDQWNQQWKLYQNQYPDLSAELLRRLQKKLPENWKEKSTQYIAQVQRQSENIATRKASQLALNAYSQYLPELLGGSADLTESNGTFSTTSEVITAKNTKGNYLHYGVREFGMSAMMTGMALHSGFIPYGGTFLVFCDYARNAIRLAALMKQRVIFVYTHDSIGLGEDGPTHQPVEHLAMLRMTPNLSVWRPCDALESAIAWQQAIERDTGPTCLVFSRQALPPQARATCDHVFRGGYILLDCKNTPQAIIIATGSEVNLAVAAAQQLNQQGKNIRVVSMLSVDRFVAQDASYRDHVLPPSIKARVAVEAAAKDYWYQFVGLEGRTIGLDRYGESAPANDIFKARGLTVEHIVQVVHQLLKDNEETT